MFPRSVHLPLIPASVLASAAAAALCLPAVAGAQAGDALSHLVWSQAYARPGQNVWATYHASAGATVSFSIRSADGRPVRDLGDNVPLAPGDHAVDWEGYSDSTRPVRDGFYRLVLDGVDSHGTAATLSAPITIDTHAPSIRFVTRTLTRSSKLRVRLSDAASGVRDAVLVLRGHTVASAGGGATQLVAPRPRGGWKPGYYLFTVYTKDRAGNHSSLSRGYVLASGH